MIVSGSDKSQMSCGLVLVWEELCHTKFNNITHGQTDGQSDFLGFLLKPKIWRKFADQTFKVGGATPCRGLVNNRVKKPFQQKRWETFKSSQVQKYQLGKVVQHENLLLLQYIF